MNSEIILPAPLRVLSELAALVALKDFWQTLGFTLLRWLCGIAPAFIVGTLVAALCERSRRLEAFLSPLLNTVKSVPIVAVILITLVWFSASAVPSVAVFLATFPVALENTRAAISGIDKRLIEMAEVYGFSVGKKLRLVWLPSVLPNLMAALKTCSGVGLKAVVVAELVVRPGFYSIGAQMQTARVTLETADLLAWTLLIVLLGYLFDRLLELAGRAVTRYRR